MNIDCIEEQGISNVEIFFENLLLNKNKIITIYEILTKAEHF